MGQKDYISAGISNQAKEISSQGKDHKMGQEGLQTRAGITNWCRTKGFKNFPHREMKREYLNVNTWMHGTLFQSTVYPKTFFYCSNEWTYQPVKRTSETYKNIFIVEYSWRPLLKLIISYTRSSCKVFWKNYIMWNAAILHLLSRV